MYEQSIMARSIYFVSILYLQNATLGMSIPIAPLRSRNRVTRGRLDVLEVRDISVFLTMQGRSILGKSIHEKLMNYRRC